MDILVSIGVAIGAVIASLVATFLWRNWRMSRLYGYWEAQGIKTVPPRMFGLHNLDGFKKNPNEYEEERCRKYGRTYGSYDFGRRTLCTADPEIAKQVLVKDFHIFTNRRPIKLHVPEFDANLSMAKDEQWKRIRNVVGPSFTSGKMRKMNPLIMEAAQGLIQNIISEADKQEQIDFRKFFSAFTTDVIGLTAFGVRVDALKNPEHPFVANGRKIFNKDLSIGAILPFFIPGFMRFFGRWVLKNMGLYYFFEVTGEMMRKRREQPDANRQVDLMQLMMDAREGKLEKEEKEKDDLQKGHFFQADETSKPLPAWNVSKTLSDDEIKAQAMIFFLAGHESTSLTLTYVAYDLALHPDVQEKLHKEVYDVYEQHGEFNYDVVRKMPYLEAVISESLRLHNLTTRFEREASQECVLGSTGIIVPKDAIVAIIATVIHHDPEWFPEPEKFKPDRFLPENRSSIVPYTYMPFGDGPRNCVAMRFALLEFKLCLAMLIRQIKFVATDDTKKKLEYYNSFGSAIPKQVLIKPERRI